MRKLRAIVMLVITLSALFAYAGTVTGVINTATSGPVKNGALTFVLTQSAVQTGTATIVSTPVACYTDSTGNVRGLPTPLAATLSTNTASGTLLAGTYFVRTTWSNTTGESEASAEQTVILSAPGTVIVTPNANVPAAATTFNVYISSTSGTETKQGTVSGSVTFAAYSQSVALIAGGALPSSNTSSCSILFNDQLTPSFTGYTVTLHNSSGSSISGFPQKWYLQGGASGTVNLSSGTPLYSGVVTYPQAIIATPISQAPQSINGALNYGVAGQTSTNAGNQAARAFIDSQGTAATAGFVRMATSDQQCWRNAANGGNVCLSDAGAAAAATGNIGDALAYSGGGYQGAAFVDQSAAPATVGVVRTANNVISMAARNAANNGNIQAISVNSSDLVTLGSGPFLIPAVSDTAVGKATTDTLTNKTLTSPVINGTPTGNISTFSMLQGSCLGTASAGTTLGLNFGPCTSGVGVNMVVGTSATIKNLFCAANTGGVNASSGAVSVSKNGSAQTLTCTFGTATACNDTTHSFSVVSGDKLVLAFTTQAAETLATVACTIQVQ